MPRAGGQESYRCWWSIRSPSRRRNTWESYNAAKQRCDGSRIGSRKVLISGVLWTNLQWCQLRGKRRTRHVEIQWTWRDQLVYFKDMAMVHPVHPQPTPPDPAMPATQKELERRKMCSKMFTAPWWGKEMELTIADIWALQWKLLDVISILDLFRSHYVTY